MVTVNRLRLQMNLQAPLQLVQAKVLQMLETIRLNIRLLTQINMYGLMEQLLINRLRGVSQKPTAA